MENSIVVFILGIAIGYILSAKPDALRNMTPKAFAYTLLGLALVGATFLLGWAGFACVMSTFVLYHAVGSAGWSSDVANFFSFKWLKKKDTTVPPDPSRVGTPNTIRRPHISEEVVEDPIAELDAARQLAKQEPAIQTENAANFNSSLKENG